MADTRRTAKRSDASMKASREIAISTRICRCLCGYGTAHTAAQAACRPRLDKLGGGYTSLAATQAWWRLHKLGGYTGVAATQAWRLLVARPHLRVGEGSQQLEERGVRPSHQRFLGGRRVPNRQLTHGRNNLRGGRVAARHSGSRGGLAWRSCGGCCSWHTWRQSRGACCGWYTWRQSYGSLVERVVAGTLGGLVAAAARRFHL